MPRFNEDGTLHIEATVVQAFWLLGLIHGHYDMPLPNEDDAIDPNLMQEAVNMGIAIVVPAEKIIDTLNHPKLVQDRDEGLARFREKTNPVEDTAND